METQRQSQNGEEPGSPRGLTIFLVVLPPAFLGLAYFLFTEYALRDSSDITPGVRLHLRLGGLGLLFLALVSAAACGYLLHERWMRPLRLLLRLAESGEVPPGRRAYLRGKGREYLGLFRLLSVLVSQNKAGARAMEELEQLRVALARFREELARTGQHGIPPEVSVSGPLREVGTSLQSKRNDLLAFFRDLRERVIALREELAALGVVAGLSPEAPAEMPATPAGDRSLATPAAASNPGPVAPSAVQSPEPVAPEGGPATERVSESVERLRRLGTVLALEAARSAGASGERAQQLLQSFQSGLSDLVSVLRLLSPTGDDRDNGGPKREATETESRAAPLESMVECRRLWSRLMESCDSIERRLAEVEDR